MIERREGKWPTHLPCFRIMETWVIVRGRVIITAGGREGSDSAALFLTVLN